MNAKKLGILRELLTAASAALIAYGLGSAGLWEEVTGGIVAIVMLVWGIRSNAGFEAISSSFRKAMSAAAGVLVMTGYLTPDKAEVILGVLLQAVSFGWSLAGKSDDEGKPTLPPAVPLLILLAACSFLLPGCAEYPITGSVMLRDPKSGAKGGLVFEPGKPIGSSVKIPVFGEDGSQVGYVDLKSSK